MDTAYVLGELQALGIRQSALARWFRVTRQTVFDWYHGKKPVPRYHHLDLLHLAATARALAAAGQKPQQALRQIAGPLLDDLEARFRIRTTGTVPADLLQAWHEAVRRQDLRAAEKALFNVAFRTMVELHPRAADPATLCLTPEYLIEVMRAALWLLMHCESLLEQYVKMADRKVEF
jgi:hypothetical protein